MCPPRRKLQQVSMQYSGPSLQWHSCIPAAYRRRASFAVHLCALNISTDVRSALHDPCASFTVLNDLKQPPARRVPRSIIRRMLERLAIDVESYSRIRCHRVRDHDWMNAAPQLDAPLFGTVQLCLTFFKQTWRCTWTVGCSRSMSSSEPWIAAE